MVAWWQAKAGITGIAPVTCRTLRQAVVIINRVARRAARPCIAAATGGAAGLGLQFTRLGN